LAEVAAEDKYHHQQEQIRAAAAAAAAPTPLRGGGGGGYSSNMESAASLLSQAAPPPPPPPPKTVMDSSSYAREAAAPFATGATVASTVGIMAEKERALLAANTRKVELEGELQRLSGTAGGSRSIRERQRLVAAGQELEVVNGELYTLRRWLRLNCPK